MKMIQNRVIGELKKQYPDCMEAETDTLFDALVQVYETTNRKFYIIIDEWEALLQLKGAGLCYFCVSAQFVIVLLSQSGRYALLFFGRS